MEWILFTPQQAAQADNDEGTIYRVAPRLVDRVDHENYGMYVAPSRIVTQPDYSEVWGPRLINYPRITASPDDLFLPPEL